MADFQTITIQRSDAVATVTLNRPDLRNAMNPEMIGEITRAFSDLSSDDGIRVVVIGGAGPAFCAGGDLNWMRDVLGQTEDEVVADSRHLLNMYRAINDCPKRVIARVHGAAFAGALGIIASADTVIAARGTKFCVSEVKIGLVAAVIAAFILPRTGPGWFRHLATSGVLFDADAARTAGLVHEIADDADDLDTRTKAQVELALQSSPDAIIATGELISALGYNIDQSTFDTALQFNAKARLSPEAQEGISAFLEKRKPDWWEVANGGNTP